MSKDELSAVDHITLSVADIEQTVKWYQSSFDCEVVFQNTTQALLRFQNIDLALALPSQQQPHLGFVKSDANTYGELLDQADGRKSTFVSDPAGNVVELIAN